MGLTACHAGPEVRAEERAAQWFSKHLSRAALGVCLKPSASVLFEPGGHLVLMWFLLPYPRSPRAEAPGPAWNRAWQGVDAQEGLADFLVKTVNEWKRDSLERLAACRRLPCWEGFSPSEESRTEHFLLHRQRPAPTLCPRGQRTPRGAGTPEPVPWGGL